MLELPLFIFTGCVWRDTGLNNWSCFLLRISRHKRKVFSWEDFSEIRLVHYRNHSHNFIKCDHHYLCLDYEPVVQFIWAVIMNVPEASGLILWSWEKQNENYTFDRLKEKINLRLFENANDFLEFFGNHEPGLIFAHYVEYRIYNK